VNGSIVCENEREAADIELISYCFLIKLDFFYTLLLNECNCKAACNIITRAVLSQGEPRDAAVYFDTYQTGIVRFLCHSIVFLYTSVTIQMLKLHTVYADFHGRDAKLKITACDQNHGKSHGDHEYVIILQRK